MAPPFFQNGFNPFTWSPSHPGGDIGDQMLTLGRSMMMPPQKSGNVDLTDRYSFRSVRDSKLGPSEPGQSPYDRWMELMGDRSLTGQTTQEELTDMIRSEQYQQAGNGTENYPGGLRWLLANAIVQAHKAAAYGQMLSEYPTLVEALSQDAIDKANSLTTEAPDSASSISRLFGGH